MVNAKRPSGRYAALLLAPALLVGTGARAETVILSCKSPPSQNVCASHWMIDSDSKMVTWRWCKSEDSTERRNVEMTATRITFDEEFMARHYDFNRQTGQLTMTAATSDGERFDDGVSTCRTESR
ncbi:MAG: hypothetical protein ABIT68_04175 [Sphingomicrobium sp.]